METCKFLTIKQCDFSMGTLSLWSEGKRHFCGVDVRRFVLIISCSFPQVLLERKSSGCFWRNVVKASVGQSITIDKQYCLFCTQVESTSKKAKWKSSNHWILLIFFFSVNFFIEWTFCLAIHSVSPRLTPTFQWLTFKGHIVTYTCVL